MGGPVGVDLGSHSVKVVRLGRRLSRPSLASAVTVPAGAVREGAVAEQAAVATALRTAVGGREGARVRGRAVVGVSQQQGAVRLLRLPRMNGRELEAALSFEVGKLSPWPGEQTCSDHLVLDRRGGEMEVLVGLARREAVAAAVSACEEAGLGVRGADLEAVAALRAIEALGLTDRRWAGTFAVADLGAAACRITVFTRFVPVASRVVTPGGREMTAALAERLGVPLEEAERLKAAHGLDDPAVAEALAGSCRRLYSEVWRSLEFHLLLNPEADLHRVFCVGGTAALPGLVRALDAYLREQLATRLGRNVAEGLAVAVAPGAGDPGRHATDRPRLDGRFVVALGLALWRE